MNGYFKLNILKDGDIAEFVASVGLYTHKQYAKRVSRGVHIKPERITLEALKKRIKNVKIREKINSFFEGRKNKKNKKIYGGFQNVRTEKKPRGEI